MNIEYNYSCDCKSLNRHEFSMKWSSFMEIKRDSYLKQLISYRFDGLVKVITESEDAVNPIFLKIYTEII